MSAQADTSVSGASFSDLSKRELPSNNEAEMSVIAACMIKGDVADEICVMLTPSNFKNIIHRNIFEAIFDIVKAGETPESIAVIDKMKSQGKCDEVVENYIGNLMGNTYALSNWKKHAEIVKRVSIQRELISAATEINALAYDAPDSISEVVGQAERILFNVTEKRVSNSFLKIDELCNQAYDELLALQNRKEEILGVPTGFKDLDTLFCGLRAGDLVVLAARPGVGKTSFALNMAVNSAKKGTSIAFFSLEMSKSQLVNRILCSEAQVELSKIRSGHLSEADWSQLNPTMQQLSTLDISIDDTPGLSILEARAKARRQLRGIVGTDQKGMIIVDYLQLMTPPVARRDGNRAVEVGEISRGLKILAKELGVPVIALSQLNRSVEMRGAKYKRPMLSDLRESGSIEQDADIVIFIDRSMDEEEAMIDGRPELGTAEIQVAKHRNGPTKDVTLAFRGEFTRFSDFVDASRVG